MREAFEKYAAENGYSAKRYMDFGAYEDGTVQAMWNAYHEAARAIEQLRAEVRNLQAGIRELVCSSDAPTVGSKPAELTEFDRDCPGCQARAEAEEAARRAIVLAAANMTPNVGDEGRAPACR